MRRTHRTNAPSRQRIWFNQNAADANLGDGDCIPANVLSQIKYALPLARTQGLTVNMLSQVLFEMFPGKYKRGYDWTLILDLIPVAARWGVQLRHYSRIDFAKLDELMRRGPVTLLVDYDKLRYRYYPNYHNGHALGGWGRDGSRIDISDPYAPNVSKGGRILIPQAELWEAWSSTEYFSVPRQCLAFVNTI